ncbi:MAG: hypothetical protein K2X69_07785 [Silvanigrellaceae bacterium]|nr:hypothetical protein [Silvanigrellaceae bacterium]
MEQAYSGSYLFCVDENNTNTSKWAPPNSVTYEWAPQDTAGFWLPGSLVLFNHPIHDGLNISVNGKVSHRYKRSLGDWDMLDSGHRDMISEDQLFQEEADENECYNVCKILVDTCIRNFGNEFKLIGAASHGIAKSDWAYVSVNKNICPNWNYPKGYKNATGESAWFFSIDTAMSVGTAVAGNLFVESGSVSGGMNNRSPASNPSVSETIFTTTSDVIPMETLQTFTTSQRLLNQRTLAAIKGIPGRKSSQLFTTRALELQFKMEENASETIPDYLYRGDVRNPQEVKINGLKRTVESVSTPGTDDYLVDLFRHTGSSMGTNGKIISLTASRSIAENFKFARSGFLYRIKTNSQKEQFLRTSKLIIEHGDRLINEKKLLPGLLVTAIRNIAIYNEDEVFYLKGTIPSELIEYYNGKEWIKMENI